MLVEFDMAAITAAGYSLETPIIITNKDDYLDILPVEGKTIIQGDVLIHTVLR